MAIKCGKNVAANIARNCMIIATIVAILQLLEPGISGNKSILRQYCDKTAAGIDMSEHIMCTQIKHRRN